MSSDLLKTEKEESAPKKESRQILRHEIFEGLDALERPTIGLFISGISAGLDVGFSLFLMAVLRTLCAAEFSEPLLKLLMANAYSVGFVFVILGRSELFTEQTTLAVLPVLNGRSSVNALARLWGVVYVANLIGAAAFAALAVLIGPALGVIEPSVFGEIARRMTAHPAEVVFASAVLAGWLMGLLSWLVAAGRDTISQVVLVWLIGSVIGVAGLHHVVVGSVEVLAGVFSGYGIGVTDYGHFVLWATLGNVVGGSFFVALIKYSYVVQGTRPLFRLGKRRKEQ